MSRRTIPVAVAIMSLMVGTAGWVWAQSGSRPSGGMSSGNRPSGGGGVTRSQSQTRQGSIVRAEEPFEVRFWNYLQQVQYRNWAPLTGQTDDFYPGHSPHGEKVKLYANRAAVAHSEEPPHGSILVKENYDRSGKTLMAITVMYRSKDYDRDNGDWVWTKYEPDGQVSVMKGLALTGKIGMCIQCHKSAEGGDFVFANDGR